MNDFIKLLKLRHVLYLTNFCLFVLITFITWDVFWWWDIGTWDTGGRVFFVMMFFIINGIATGGFYDWKKVRDKDK